MIRRTIFLLAATCWGNLVFAGELAKREDELYEYVQDMNALVKTGLSRAELGQRMPDLNIKFDRYLRNGGEPFGSLYVVINSFRELEVKWDEGNRDKLKGQNYDPMSRLQLNQIVDDGLQRYFGYVQKAISDYEDERQKKTQKMQSQAPSRKSKK